MIRRAVRYALVSVLFIIVQTKILRLLSIEGITPDLLTVWIAYIALREGQLTGTLWGFGVGLLFDIVAGDFIGLAAFSGTIAGFAAGYFYNENKTLLTLGSYRFIVVTLIVSAVHNLFYFTIYTRGSEISILRAVFEIGLATTLYTGILSLLPMIVFSRRLAR
ncbi:MAG TPA: rod shape-determining protein MreD [Bacteroidota bacterium]|nr:rod shape-determining protein MreD [Bacteroidota bacterium]